MLLYIILCSSFGLYSKGKLLARKYQTRVDVTDSDKHSSLQWCSGMKLIIAVKVLLYKPLELFSSTILRVNILTFCKLEHFEVNIAILFVLKKQSILKSKCKFTPKSYFVIQTLLEQRKQIIYCYKSFQLKSMCEFTPKK